MQRFCSIILLCLTVVSVEAQTDSAAIHEILVFQKELNEEYTNPKTTPLNSVKLKHFKEHDFFDIDMDYSVQANLTVTGTMPFFQMKTSSQMLKNYRVYGMVKFSILGRSFEMPVYQSQQLMETDKYKDYLFFPFTDLTNGNLTYTAGRYIDLYIPKEGNLVIIDFNKAYNPFCAYSDKYNCPIVPEDNHLDIEVLAGIKYEHSK